MQSNRILVQMKDQLVSGIVEYGFAMGQDPFIRKVSRFLCRQSDACIVFPCPSHKLSSKSCNVSLQDVDVCFIQDEGRPKPLYQA